MKKRRFIVWVGIIFCCSLLYGCRGDEDTIFDNDVCGGDFSKDDTSISEITPWKETVVPTEEAILKPEPTVEPTKIAVEEKSNTIQCEVEGNTLIFSGNGPLTALAESELISGISLKEVKRIVIEEGITEIGDQLFSLFYTELKEVDLAETVGRIGEGAFFYCPKLTTVNFPEGIVCIENMAFSHCSSLTTIELPDSIKMIGEDAFAMTPWFEEQKEKYGYVMINGVLLDGTALAEPESILANVSYTTKSAFSNEWLEKQREDGNLIIINDILIDGGNAKGEVVIPEEVKHIADGAFSECVELTGVQLPQGLKTIGVSAFFGCTNLVDIVIPETVGYIGESAFSDCTNLVNIELPREIDFIAQGLFNGCEKLESVILQNNITYIGDMAFYGCTSLVCLELPDSIVEIGYCAFQECAKLKELNLPDKVKRIDRFVFRGCENLERVKLSKNLTKIPDSMFAFCNSLTYITIPEGVTEIGQTAFYNCSSLVGVFIPNSVTVIEGGAFDGCNNLTLYCEEDFMAEQYLLEMKVPYISVEKEFWAENSLESEKRFSLEEKMEMYIGDKIIVNGEECYAIWGEDGAYVWKYIDATFDEPAHYIGAYAVDISETDLPSNVSWDACRIAGWHRVPEQDYFYVQHIGDDVFDVSGYYVIGHENCVLKMNSWLDDDNDYLYRLTLFNDGYALGHYVDVDYTLWKKEYKGYWLVLLDEYGNMMVSDIAMEPNAMLNENRPGIYSDGVFYYQEAFYDTNFNKVLDLSKKDWGNIYAVTQDVFESYAAVHAPYFVNGVCRMITYKNGKYWAFDIDKSGKVISDIEEFDITMLGY